MTDQSRALLEALTKSANIATAENARMVLENRHPFHTPATAEELAVKGTLGGLIQTVMKGSLEDVWCKADTLNQQAIAQLIPLEIRLGISLDTDL